MSHKKYRLIILAVALLIIGMRGLCAAQFSRRPSVQRSDTQELNDVQHVSHPGNERIEGRFVFRVKKYVVQFKTAAFLECGDLAPLCYRSRLIKGQSGASPRPDA